MKELDRVKEKLGIVRDLQHAAAVLDWDQQTYIPPMGISARSRQLATLHMLAHQFFIDEEMGKNLEAVYKHISELDEDDQALVKVTAREYEKQKRIPARLIEELTQTTSKAIDVWAKAKENDDYHSFKPFLQKIVDLSRKMAEYLGFEKHPYDALVDQYEPGMTTEKLNTILEPLGDALAKMLPAFSELSANISTFDGPFYPKEAQLEFSRKIIVKLGFQFDKGRLDLSAHPFTTSFDPSDVRLTTRVDENNFKVSFFGTVHEGGHGIYEQHLPEKFARTPLGDAASLGFHESQSRFFENILSRHPAFWILHFPEWKETFPEASSKGNLHDLIKYVNAVQPSLIRVEADEVTYNLHIIIRFLLERDLMDGTLTVDELPNKWNALYKQYLGIEPNSNSTGVLQDIHWSAGLLGYFPTYALGNIISAQLKDKMEQDLDNLENLITQQRFKEIVQWLDEHVYRHGKKYLPEELLKKATGKELSIEPFLNYLREKYEKILQFK